jgi:ketosteroid isomerase-like protein
MPRFDFVPTLLVFVTLLCGCARSAPSLTPDRVHDADAVGVAIDDFHDAAAKADEARYFAHMTETGVFLGTDGTERWTKAEFFAYAHPHFAKGKAWTMRSVSRHVMLSADGNVAWFDESLATTKLGPCRGSGVLVRDHSTGRWLIEQYNLATVVPNDKYDAVKRVIDGGPSN